jgi:hypothetical protein
MLKSTFLHLQRFEKKTERNLWEKGITTWDLYLKTLLRQPFLFQEIPEQQNLLSDSIKAYEEEDMAYFAKSLPSGDEIDITFSSGLGFRDCVTQHRKVHIA